jgi:hypothetical protein
MVRGAEKILWPGSRLDGEVTRRTGGHGNRWGGTATAAAMAQPPASSRYPEKTEWILILGNLIFGILGY